MRITMPELDIKLYEELVGIVFGCSIISKPL